MILAEDEPRGLIFNISKKYWSGVMSASILQNIMVVLPFYRQIWSIEGRVKDERFSFFKPTSYNYK